MTGSGDNGARATPATSGTFATTHWSVVLAAADQKRPEAAEALETLYRTYWYPLYAYAQVGDRLGLSEGAVKSEVHRLRQRYRAVLREHIAQTVATPAEVAEEIRYLISVLSE